MAGKGAERLSFLWKDLHKRNGCDMIGIEKLGKNEEKITEGYWMERKKMENDRRIAVLIDADNVSSKYIKFIFDEIANHGIPTYKRIYGDWTRPNLGAWKEVLLEYSISPIQQYGYTSGKNATDSALIIDAMDILYSKNVDGFCIVSSDSDFTRLAARLRESGMFVLGMGEKKTPRPFIVACEKFKYFESLSNAATEQAERMKKHPQEGTIHDIEELARSIQNIVDEISDEDGWAFLGDVGNILSKRFPDFDTRNYGYKKLTPLVSSLNQYIELDSRPTSDPHITHKYIKNRRR